MRRAIVGLLWGWVVAGLLGAGAGCTQHRHGAVIKRGEQVAGDDPSAGFVAVAAGLSHSLGLKDDGAIAAWGRNGLGQCDVPEPNTAFVAIAAGSDHSLGVKADGSIVAWGGNSYGQCNVPSPNTGFVSVEGGR